MPRRVLLDAHNGKDEYRHVAHVEHLEPGTPVIMRLTCGCNYKTRVPLRAKTIVIQGSNKCAFCPAPPRDAAAQEVLETPPGEMAAQKTLAALCQTVEHEEEVVAAYETESAKEPEAAEAAKEPTVVGAVRRGAHS